MGRVRSLGVMALAVLCACGSGGGPDPTTPTYVGLSSELERGTCTGGSFTSGGWRVGESPDGEQWMLLVTFDLGGLPSWATIISAQVVLPGTAYQCSDPLDPFLPCIPGQTPDLGLLVVDHLQCPLGLAPGHCSSAPLESAMAVLERGEGSIWSAWVTSAVQSDFSAGRDCTCLRIRFEVPTDADGVTEYVNFASSIYSPFAERMLKVWYQTY